MPEKNPIRTASTINAAVPSTAKRQRISVPVMKAPEWSQYWSLYGDSGVITYLARLC